MPPLNHHKKMIHDCRIRDGTFTQPNRSIKVEIGYFSTPQILALNHCDNKWIQGIEHLHAAPRVHERACVLCAMCFGETALKSGSLKLFSGKLGYTPVFWLAGMN